jgi:hypothetical protein
MRLPNVNTYRVAAGLLVVFATMHTLGGLFGPHRFGAEPEAVFSAMKAVQFQTRGATCSWYGFWMGFGLVTTVFLLVSAAVAWHLGGMDPGDRRKVAPIGWALFAGQVAMAALSWAYFFPPPGVTATLVAALVGLGCVRDLRLDATRHRSPA